MTKNVRIMNKPRGYSQNFLQGWDTLSGLHHFPLCAGKRNIFQRDFPDNCRAAQVEWGYTGLKIKVQNAFI